MPATPLAGGIVEIYELVQHRAKPFLILLLKHWNSRKTSIVFDSSGLDSSPNRNPGLDLLERQLKRILMLLAADVQGAQAQFRGFAWRGAKYSSAAEASFTSAFDSFLCCPHIPFDIFRTCSASRLQTV